MDKRKLGKSSLSVAPLALGCNVFGWTIDEKTSFTILDAFTDAGFNLLDTADVYSRWKPGNQGGESETIIGNWLKESGKREKIVLATKVGSDMGQGKLLTKKYILNAVEDSLKRLQTDYIDLYQTHFDDDKTSVEETLDAYGQLVTEGKVRVIGASNLSPARFMASLEASKKFGFPTYQTFQPEYNLYVRDKFEKEIEPICVEHQIGVISYFSLASGFLTGKYRSESDLTKSARGGGMKKYMDERGFRILNVLDQLAQEYNTTQASIALAWVMARPSISAPISSATSLTQLSDLIKSTEVRLRQDSIQLLNEASA
ncbi:MAG TPA: aldo/keto reductase [Cyclobacteriaceae bacterium]|jgi:aryl-alcohol dehydrogenase-like predicted oxidoreductase|nr:aldo/keto reductase [Cyclobacteriaceae bacterium]